jgi:predicted alpha/beta hydrolase family esterase
MPTIAGLPYVKAEFDKNGAPLNQVTVPAGLTDVIIFSHGWNNNAAEAQSLYERFFESFTALPQDPALAARKFGVIGVFWPSKKFDESVAVETNGAAGGAASLSMRSSSLDALAQKLDSMQGFFDTPAQQAALNRLKELLPQLEDKASARAEFMTTIRGAIVSPEAADKEDGSLAFFKDPPEDVMKRLRISSAALPVGSAPSGAMALPTSAKPQPSATGGAAGFREFLSGFGAAAMNALNFTTYFEMKARAGKVGAAGVAALIDALPAEVKRVHLVGHSFGGRVVTAAAQSSNSDKIAAMALLQAAFSHNGFSAQMKGAFRNVVEKKRVNGPIIVTHTKNDKAVGIAYPIASRLAGDAAAALGDENDKFGGLGRNGVQKMETDERAVGTLLDVGNAYDFKSKRFFNLEGQQFITGHSDITGRQVAYAVQRAIAVT